MSELGRLRSFAAAASALAGVSDCVVEQFPQSAARDMALTRLVEARLWLEEAVRTTPPTTLCSDAAGEPEEVW